MRALIVWTVLLFVVAQPLRADDWEAFADAAGIYRGDAVSGGGVVPVTTELETTADGSLSGSYVFIENGRSYRGTLTHGRIAGPLSLVFIWHDDWGFGTLHITFTRHFGGFSGMWSTLEDTGVAFPWTGLRVEP